MPITRTHQGEALATFPVDDALRQVVDELLASFDETTGNWHPAWSQAAALPHNATTGVPYHGINTVMLWAFQLKRGYSGPRWATYKQWSSVGAQVNRGAKAVRGVRWVLVGKTDDDPDSGVLRLKVFALFNADDVTESGQDPFEEPLIESDWYENFCQFVEAVPFKSTIGEPCYVPALDVVSCPRPDTFTSAEAWAHTISHELGHWTGKRLERKLHSRYDIEAYAYEELVADISSALTCGWFQIPPGPTRDDHVRYVKGWLAALDNDPKILMAAAQDAQRATDHLLAYFNA